MRQSAIEAFFSPELSDSIRTSRQRRVAADRERSGIMPKPLPASRDSHPFPGQARRVPPSLRSQRRIFRNRGWVCSWRGVRRAAARAIFGHFHVQLLCLQRSHPPKRSNNFCFLNTDLLHSRFFRINVARWGVKAGFLNTPGPQRPEVP